MITPRIEAIKEQHAVVGEDHLADPPAPRAADQPGGCDRMVGSTERSLGEQLVTVESPDRAVDARHFDRLSAGEWGKDRGQPPCEHCLAGPGWAAQQTVVGARGRDRECLHSDGLAAYFTDVRALAGRATVAPCDRFWQRVGGAPRQYARGTGEALDHADRGSPDEHRLVCSCGSQHEHRQTGLHRRLGDRERAVAAAHLAVE
jgi:hypothetical protein